MKKPKFLVRPDDYEVFSLNEDGETYSIRRQKIDFPNSLHNSYTQTLLEAIGCFEGSAECFAIYREKQRQYHNYSVSNSHDCHNCCCTCEEDDE